MCPSIGLAGAAAALDDDGACGGRGEGRGGRTRARGGASRAGGHTRVPSAGNFLLLHAGAECEGALRGIAPRGVIVRPVGNYGLPEHLRVTLGTPEQNDRFLKAWEGLIACRGNEP